MDSMLRHLAIIYHDVIDIIKSHDWPRFCHKMEMMREVTEDIYIYVHASVLFYQLRQSACKMITQFIETYAQKKNTV